MLKHAPVGSFASGPFAPRPLTTRRRVRASSVDPAAVDLGALVDSVVTAATSSAEVHPIIQAHVCPAVVECLGLPLGSLDRQQRVVDAWYDLSAALNTAHGDAFVLRALIYGDAPTARQLALALDVYNAGLGMVHAALDRLADVAPDASV